MNLIKFENLQLEPFNLLKTCLEEAEKLKLKNYNAMVVSTTKPSSRVVLLQELNNEGLIFYTNYQSNKALEINNNASVAINFYWPELDKQIRIEGKALKVSEIKSINYFASRPRKSQIAAWASSQSRNLESYKNLIDNFKKYEEKFTNLEVPKPDFWGGFIIKPESFEFWQDVPNRLHKRILYKLTDKIWIKSYLNP